jgi:hypothetical protein
LASCTRTAETAATESNLAPGHLSPFALNALAYVSALVQQHRLARPHSIEVGKMGKFFPI